MNDVLELLHARCSTRAYADVLLTTEEKDAILDATFRAPTAGNMVLYSIVEIEDPQLKARLAVTCDDQPFIATAPWVLVFLADYQKWTDLFDAAGLEGRRAPGPGDLLLACSDALIAAQNAVVAAESLGVGSCYIGDILENGEQHAKLLDLPPHTLPVAMLCFGHPKTKRAPAPRYTKHVVHRDRYRRLTAEELTETSQELQEVHAPHGLASGVSSYPQAIHDRKYASEFMAEMNRSVAWWLDRWQHAAPTPRSGS